MRAPAIIPAAGVGHRMKSSVRKQFLTLLDRPLLDYSIEAVDSCKMIEKVILVVCEDDLAFCRDRYLKKRRLSTPVEILPGGKDRQESVYLGLRHLQSLDEAPQWIVIHDGARPLVTNKIIKEVLKAAYKSMAAIAAVPVSDTMKIVKEDKLWTDKTLDREKVWAAQTPQAFSFPLLLEAHKQAEKNGFKGTDDASLLERLGHSVCIVEGEDENIKITRPVDLKLAELILSSRKGAL